MAKRRAEDAADEAPAAKGAATDAPGADARKDKFTLHLKALNKQFAKWIAGQAEAHSGELWRDGVRDYLKHADRLMDDFKDVVQAEMSSPPAGSPPAPSAFGSSSAFGNSPIKFGAPVIAGSAGSGSAPSLFGKPPTPAAPAAPKSGGLFSFGGGGSATPAASPAPAASSLFSFKPAPAAPTPATSEGGDGGGDNNDGDDDDEPKRESSPSLKDDETVEKQYDLLWSNKSKLFLQPEGGSGWDDVGVGMFSIRRMKEGKGSATPYLVFMSSAGKVLLTASLYKGLAPTIGKNAKLVLMKLVLSGQEGETKDKMVLVKFAKDETAKECKEKVEELCPK